MQIHVRKYTSYKTAQAEPEYFYELYTQPIKDRLYYLLFKLFDKVIYFKPVRWVIEHPLEKYNVIQHEKTCNNDCVMGKWRKSTDEEWTEGPMCGYHPTIIRFDLKLFDLDRKNNAIIEHRLQASKE